MRGATQGGRRGGHTYFKRKKKEKSTTNGAFVLHNAETKERCHRRRDFGGWSKGVRASRLKEGRICERSKLYTKKEG